MKLNSFVCGLVFIFSQLAAHHSGVLPSAFSHCRTSALRYHAIGQDCLNGACSYATGHYGSFRRSPLCSNKIDDEPPWLQHRSRKHGADGIKEVDFCPFNNGLRQLLRRMPRDVSTEFLR